MMTRLTSIPIFRRLFLSYFLAILLPNTLILILSIVYSNALLSHGVSRRQLEPLTIATILAVLLSTGVVIGLGYLMNTTITQPLQQLVTLAKRIGQGETNARASVVGRDEIAIVAASMNSMLDRIVQLLQETQGQHAALQEQIAHLIAEVSDLGEGDLRTWAQVPPGVLGMLARAYNAMVERLSHLVIRIKTAALEVERATTATRREMHHLITTTNRQLHEIATMTTAVEGMAASCREGVERAQMLDRMAQEARQSAQQGKQAVQQTLEEMGHLHENAQHTASHIAALGTHSTEIDTVVKTLEHITQQINRLSLDAAIQVALAGDAHRSGFAAVADGIRHLAEETQTNLSTIARDVRHVQTEIGTVVGSAREAERSIVAGARRVQETGDILATIFGLVEQQAGEIEHITRMNLHLLEAVPAVSQQMQMVAESTRQGSTSTDAVVQEMHQLIALATTLHTVVNLFKLKQTFSANATTHHLLAAEPPSLP